MKYLAKFTFCLSLMLGQAMSGIFNSKTATLTNGLQIIVVPDSIGAIVTVGVLYKVGTADDPPSLVGISHFLEHMMFKGTHSIPTSQFKRRIIERGGNTNACTSYDYTLYNTSIDAEHLEMIISMEADRMANLTFSEAEVKSERDVVLEERKMRLENHPFGQAYESLLRSLYWYHPYGVHPIGYPHHIKSYSYQALRQHYETWYCPNNAVLIVCGRTTLEQVLPLAQKYFGDIPLKKIPDRNRVPEPDHQGISQHIEQTNPRNAVILLNWCYFAPNYRSTTGREHYYPLIVLSQMLGGNETTHFYRNFVEDKKIALSIGSAYETKTYDAQTFDISARLSPNMSVDAFKKALAEYIQKLLISVSPAEVEKAKRHIIASLAFARDGNETTLGVLIHLATGFNLEEIESAKEYIQAVTPEQVHQAAIAVLGKSPRVTMDLYPVK